MGRRRTAEWTAWAIAAATLASQVAVAWLVAANREALPDSVVEFLPQYVVSVVLIPLFPALAAVILRRFPRHPIGWILLAATGSILLDAVARVYAIVGLYLDPGGLPGPEWAAWFADWNWVPGVMLLLVFVPLLFPDGTLPSPRWRPVAIGLVVWLAATTVGYALVPEPLVDFDVTKPVQVAAAYPLAWGMLLIPVAVGIALAAVVVRRRRATGDEREQMRWVVWALGVAVPLWTLSMVVGLLGERGWGLVQAVLLLGPVVMIPVAITIAIVKYRLYDIDTLINRTLVYGALTASVLAGYAVVVLAVSGATGSTVEWRWSVLVVAAVAIVAYPLREWLQRRVNRFMYGDRDDPGPRAVATVPAHLRRADPDRRCCPQRSTPSRRHCGCPTWPCGWPATDQATTTRGLRRRSPGPPRRTRRDAGTGRPRPPASRAGRRLRQGPCRGPHRRPRPPGGAGRHPGGRAALGHRTTVGGRPAADRRRRTPGRQSPRTPSGWPRTCKSHVSGWSRPVRRSADGCAATCTTRSGRRWPAWRSRRGTRAPPCPTTR